MVDERLQKYRWAARVELTSDKLLNLLLEAPNPAPRKPEIDTKLIDALIGLTGYQPTAGDKKEINITFTHKKNQRDWMREIAEKHHFDQDKTIAEYTKLDEKGEIPRSRKSQPAEAYARAMWNDGIGKNWLRDLDRSEFGADLQLILDLLNEKQVRATYGAVAEALAVHVRQVVQLLGDRRPEASWIVNKRTHEPTEYDERQKHPALYKNAKVISSGEVLRSMLGW